MPAKRGSSLLEFVMTLPFAVLLLFITMDTGKAIFVKTSMQSAAANAATSGARGGGIDTTIPIGCGAPITKIVKSFCTAANWEDVGVTITAIKATMVNYEGVEGKDNWCTAKFPYVKVEATGTLENMLTPGVNTALIKSFSFPTEITVQSTAYCEVYRE